MKGCTGCGRMLTAESFSVRTSWPDGSVRSRHSRCAMCRTKARKATERRKARAIAAVDREARTWLAIGPWRAWLSGMILGPHRSWQMADPPAEPIPADFLAERLGVNPSRVWAWRHTAGRVDIDTLDRALCHAREPWVLRELYPHLWDLDEALEQVAA
jgi:hypothetical protein